MRSKKDGVKTERTKHSNKFQSKTHNKKVRKAGKKEINKSMEEDEESYKDFKKKGKIELDAPNVKDRKAFSKVTQKHKAKKGKGSYDRKNKTIDENVNLRKKQENQDISRMVDSILEKKYSDAHKYLKSVIDSKIQRKMEEELDKPLF